MTEKTLILIYKAKRLSKAVEIHLQQIKQQKLNEERNKSKVYRS
jgi:hypothetical protein